MRFRLSVSAGTLAPNGPSMETVSIAIRPSPVSVCHWVSGLRAAPPPSVAVAFRSRNAAVMTACPALAGKRTVRSLSA